MCPKGPRTKKLTLWIDEGLIDKAKEYGKHSGKSVSEMVSDYFRALDSEVELSMQQLSPITQKLLGSLKAGASTDDYKKHLAEKYLTEDTDKKQK